MWRWLKIAAPLGISAVLLSIMAIGFQSRSVAETLPCSGVATAVVATFESEVIWDGMASRGGDSHSFRFCGEETMYLDITVNWKGKKDLRLTIVDPNGNTYVSDNHSGTSFELFRQWGPLAHGDWEIIVSNNGKGNAKYHAVVMFR